jgi:hypothetical protein
MNMILYGILTLIIIIAFIWTCKSSIEPFSNMRPWFGYEPGYGPGWGRKGCCNKATEESINANNLA